LMAGSFAGVWLVRIQNLFTSSVSLMRGFFY